jgi:hypothetical protein
VSLKATMDRLVELESTVHPTLNVYRWWRSDMELPAVWNWLTPGDHERPPVSPPGAVCRHRHLICPTVTIGVYPTAVTGEGDMLEVEEYLDAALPIIAGEVYGRAPFGNHEARMRGSQTVTDTLGDAPILTVELPLEVYVDLEVTTTP